jgi:ADP-ribose pyrophosphatase YjhB (NUDIX family)
MTDLPQVAVGAVVVRDNSLLMVKRAQEPARGLWSIPGGRLQRGEYLTDAVRREVKEETGLDVEVGDLLGLFEVVGDPHYVILDYLASAPDGSEPSADDDVSEVRWVPLDEIANLECTPRLVETLKGWGLELGQTSEGSREGKTAR